MRGKEVPINTNQQRFFGGEGGGGFSIDSDQQIYGDTISAPPPNPWSNGGPGLPSLGSGQGMTVIALIIGGIVLAAILSRKK